MFSFQLLPAMAGRNLSWLDFPKECLFSQIQCKNKPSFLLPGAYLWTEPQCWAVGHGRHWKTGGGEHGWWSLQGWHSDMSSYFRSWVMLAEQGAEPSFAKVSVIYWILFWKWEINPVWINGSVFLLQCLPDGKFSFNVHQGTPFKLAFFFFFFQVLCNICGKSLKSL